jgi:hypothetical protein
MYQICRDLSYFHNNNNNNNNNKKREREDVWITNWRMLCNEWIVLLDFIHHLVSQKRNKIEELKIQTKYHNTCVHKIHTRVSDLLQGFMCVCTQVSCSVVSNWPLCELCGHVYCDILSIFLIPQFCLLYLRHQMMDKVQKHNSFNTYTPLSESYRNQMLCKFTVFYFTCCFSFTI